jgi:hypothetical protein
MIAGDPLLCQSWPHRCTRCDNRRDGIFIAEATAPDKRLSGRFVPDNARR